MDDFFNSFCNSFSHKLCPHKTSDIISKFVYCAAALAFSNGKTITETGVKGSWRDDKGHQVSTVIVSSTDMKKIIVIVEKDKDMVFQYVAEQTFEHYEKLSLSPNNGWYEAVITAAMKIPFKLPRDHTLLAHIV